MDNVDGTRNSTGSITHAVELIVEFQGHREKITAEVMDLGKNSFILGFPWLKHHNPDINWTKETVKMTCCPQHCHILQPKVAFLASLEKEEYNIQYQVHETIRVLEAQQEKPKEKTSEELVPKEYHKFLKVFLKKESEHMLLWKPWDHAIDLKDTFKPKKDTSSLYHQQSRRKSQRSLMINSRKGTYALLSPPKYHWYSLFLRKMGRN